MLDKCPAVAENDDLMRAAADVVLRFGFLTEVSFGRGKDIPIDYLWVEVCDLSSALKKVDPEWRKRYGK